MTAIQYCDSDDYFFPDHACLMVADQLGWIARHPAPPAIREKIEIALQAMQSLPMVRGMYPSPEGGKVPPVL